MNAPIRVLQVVDSLAAGGTERMAVRLANGLASRVEYSGLCVTRSGGTLRGELSPSVEVLQLDRSSRVDVRAARRLRAYIRERDITVVHAHSSSVFVASAALAPRRAQPVLVWHDHNSRLDERRRLVARLSGWLADAVFAVSDDIAAWERRSGVRPEKITVQTNFVDEPTDGQLALDLPGQPGQRVVVVANLRPEKNHLRLIRAFATVVESAPDVHLLVVGSQANVDHTARIRAEIDHMGLGHQVSLLGVRGDVPAILAACDVAVLPSLDEGFPLALIEYGLAGLPVVATPVGQVPEATADGALAVLIDPLDARALASALIELLADEGRRRRLGQEFSALVRSRYSAEAVLPDIVDRYESLLNRPKAQRGVRR